MSPIPSFLVAMACGTVLSMGFAANADACDSPGKKVKIKVKLEDGQPVVDKDTVRACVGDTIHWVFAGGSNPFKVQFMNDDSPFGWPDGSNSDSASVKGTVLPGAVNNGQSTPYPYDVDVDGVAVDPKIIVEP